MKANEAPEKIYFNPLLMEDGESIVRRCTFERQSDSQIEYTRTDAFSDLEKQIEEKLVILGAEHIKYVKEGKYSFNHGMNVGQIKALSWVLEKLKAQKE